MIKMLKLVVIILCALNVSTFAVENFDVEKELSKDLKTSRGTRAKVADLKGKSTLLYFTASWCGPCQAFTPSLVKFLDKHKDDISVVVISRDRSKKAATSYLKAKKAKDFYMVLPGKASDKISGDFGIRGIPSVIVLNKDGKVVDTNGRTQIGKSMDLPDTWK
jgi:thiol-disulfide isomerase/thioredoxin